MEETNCIQFIGNDNIPCTTKVFPSFDTMQFSITEFQEFIKKNFNDKQFEFQDQDVPKDSNKYIIREQQKFVSRYADFHNKNFGSCLVYHGLGSGKCLGKDTLVLMHPHGIKKIQDVLVGDTLMGNDSEPRRVLSLGSGRSKMYKIILSDGSYFICNKDHILSLKFSFEKIPSNFSRVISVRDIAPDNSTITKDINGDIIVNMTVSEYLKQEGFYKKYLKAFKCYTDYNTQINFPNVNSVNLNDFLMSDIQDCQDLFRSKEDRLQLLADIIDTFGENIKRLNVKMKNYDIIFKCLSENDYFEIPYKSQSIEFLARSLGFKVDSQSGKIRIYGTLSKIPTKLIKKNDTKVNLQYDFKVEELPEDDYYGVVIDGNRLFVLADHTVTHNTCTSVLVGEAYKAYASDFPNKNKVIVVMPSNLQQQFKEEILGKIMSDNTKKGCLINTVSVKGEPVEYKTKKEEAISEENISDIQHKVKELFRKAPKPKNAVKELTELNIVKNLNKEQKKETQEKNVLLDKDWDFYTHGKFINQLLEKQDTDYLNTLIMTLRKGNNIIIIDEIQNLISDVGVNYRKLINALTLFSKNNKIVVLSATPIYDKPFEIGLILNLLSPRLYFPETQENFDKIFIKKKQSKISNNIETQFVNKDLLAWMSCGYVSYFSGGNPLDFPYKRIIECDHVIHHNQMVAYAMALYSDINVPKEENNEETKSFNFIANIKKYCNIAYLDDYEKDINSKKTKVTNTIKIKKMIANLKIVQQQPGINIEDAISESYSAKIGGMLKILMKEIHTSLVFSELLDYGVIPIAHILSEIYGYQEVTLEMLTKTNPNILESPGNVPRFVVWSGKIVKDRDIFSEKVRKAFNRKENIDGKYLKLILGTRSIMEGVSFENVRSVHIMNPWWNESRTKQVIARAIRFNSHKSLPIEDQCVNVYKHYAIFQNYPLSSAIEFTRILKSKLTKGSQDFNNNSKAKIKNLMKRGYFRFSVDQQIAKRASEKYEISRQFEQVIKQTAVDCNLNKNGNLTRLYEYVIPEYIRLENGDVEIYLTTYFENEVLGKKYMTKSRPPVLISKKNFSGMLVNNIQEEKMTIEEIDESGNIINQPVSTNEAIMYHNYESVIFQKNTNIPKSNSKFYECHETYPKINESISDYYSILKIKDNGEVLTSGTKILSKELILKENLNCSEYSKKVNVFTIQNPELNYQIFLTQNLKTSGYFLVDYIYSIQSGTTMIPSEIISGGDRRKENIVKGFMRLVKSAPDYIKLHIKYTLENIPRSDFLNEKQKSLNLLINEYLKILVEDYNDNYYSFVVDKIEYIPNENMTDQDIEVAINIISEARNIYDTIQDEFSGLSEDSRINFMNDAINQLNKTRKS